MLRLRLPPLLEPGPLLLPRNPPQRRFHIGQNSLDDGGHALAGRVEAVGQVQLKVARKILDNQQLDGAAAVKLIEAAADGVSKAGDALATQAAGLGGLVDVRG